jgi:hypothetical protein
MLLQLQELLLYIELFHKKKIVCSTVMIKNQCIGTKVDGT